MERQIVMILNVIRRKAVNLLLGDKLVLRKNIYPSEYRLELVDEKWRLNFGEWKVRQISEREFKLSRQLVSKY